MFYFRWGGGQWEERLNLMLKRLGGKQSYIMYEFKDDTMSTPHLKMAPRMVSW